MPDDRLERMQHEFVEKHSKEADELVFSEKRGTCLMAIYYSPKEKWIEKPLREFIKAVTTMEVQSGPNPLDFKTVQGFTAKSIMKAKELVDAVFVGPVPESVLWAVAMAFDRGQE